MEAEKKTVQVLSKAGKEEWAVWVDISSPVNHFYKTIPEPAFKVCAHFIKSDLSKLKMHHN